MFVQYGNTALFQALMQILGTRLPVWSTMFDDRMKSTMLLFINIEYPILLLIRRGGDIRVLFIASFHFILEGQQVRYYIVEFS